MRSYISDFITTLTNRRQVRVGQLLDDARVDKTQLDGLAEGLLTVMSNSVPLTFSTEAEFSPVRAGRVVGNFQDAALRMDDLFSVANLVSLLLDSHIAILSSEVKAVEDELLALEKLAANYAFLLGDSRAYNFAYLEAFNDESGRDDFASTDRAGLAFGPAEEAVVQTDQGVLVIPEQSRLHGITGRVVRGNATGYSTEEGALSHLYTAASSSGWGVTVAAPGPVTVPLADAGGRRGAQMILEFTLSQPAPASQIKLAPMADLEMELCQATIYPGGDDSEGIQLMADAETITLDRPFTLHFPLQTVSRFQILVNQPVYQRRSSQQNLVENESGLLLDEVRRRRFRDGQLEQATQRRRHQDMGALIRYVLPQGEGSDRLYASSLPTIGSLGGVFRSDRLLSALQKRSHELTSWRVTDPAARLLWRTAFQRIPELRSLLQRGWSERTSANPDVQGQVAAVVPPASQSSTPSGYDYRYRLGLSQVVIGVDSPGYKGVFVSLPLDAAGDIGEVRLKAAERHHLVPIGLSRDTPHVTSVEYSVSNRNNPDHEDAWIPILPIGTAEVAGERFFVDSAGRGYFRFPAEVTGSIRLYCNGRRSNVSNSSYLYGAGRGSVVGLTVTGTGGGNDVHTVDYVPLGDPTVVSFEAAGFSTEVPLVHTFDANGAGEGISLTTGRHEVDLNHTPYVDATQVATSAYNSSFGLSPYTPIIARLADSSYATNLTNYKGGEQAVLPAATEGFFFLHSGRSLRFNQKVEDFRVFYQYLQNTVRHRVVLRVNDTTFVSPAVDYVHVKAKTRRSSSGRSV